ncbi:MAG: diguanylate cyclase [Vicinamibacterales bacterium]|jgi:diguanylate cyclase (GGDEF)-like protein/putative nucleotidyltransferase with HDIG domain|nr:diguanylate cyclase [Vicinamibacterales bacterium]
MFRLSSVGSAIAIAAATIVVGLAEFWLRPSAALLLTPLLVSALALVFAYGIYRRDRGNQRAHQEELERSSAIQMATVEALALAIDARDRSSRSSLPREQRHATALARAFGLPADEVECIRTAALLHDIGKLAVPDHILTKPGPLTEDEWSKMRTHASVGAAIIEQVPFPQPVAALVRSHHERWDGKGYPAGLGGADIPLGARILAVVDYFAAITSDRPFNRAMPAAEAVNVLWQEAENALDPAVVSRYVELLPALQDADEEARLAVARDDVAARYREGEALLAGRPSRLTPSALLDNIGVASQELGALYAMAEAMGTSLGVADTMAALTSKLDRLVPFSTLALYLHDQANGVSRCRFASGPGHKAFPGLLVRDGEGLVGAAIASRECIINGDPAVDLDMLRDDLAQAGLRSVMVCPLMMGGTIRGALALYHTAPRAFTDEHRRLVSRVSGQIAAVINNAVVFEQTREDSVTDPLTGLPNARFLYSHAGRELARASRLKSSVTLMLLDLDNLKPINDTFGHQAGNRALCAVAAVLRGAIRPYDICVRYGGDEFIVLLSDFGADQAAAKCLELQHAVESMPFSVGDLLRVRLTISIGAAVFPADGDSYEALLQVADTRMYQDKAARKHLQAERAMPRTTHEHSDNSPVHGS